MIHNHYQCNKAYSSLGKHKACCCDECGGLVENSSTLISGCISECRGSVDLCGNGWEKLTEYIVRNSEEECIHKGTSDFPRYLHTFFTVFMGDKKVPKASKEHALKEISSRKH
jgi:hypothetical protein